MIHIDKDTFDSVILDTEKVSYLAENFSYLIDNLMSFVDPGVSNVHKMMPGEIGGKRRSIRGERSEKLGYAYRTAATKSKVSSRGTKQIDVYDTKVLVEEWTVAHGDIKDPGMGERYPTSNTNNGVIEPRGPYTCLITARISLSKKTPTRCYVQCNCKDFDTTFYEKLSAEQYTNKKSLPSGKGLKAQTPALCKHLYAIIDKYYMDLIKDTEGLVADQNAALFGGGSTGPTTGPNGGIQPQPPTMPLTPKEISLQAIAKRLKSESDRLKGLEGSYLDLIQSGAGHHLFMFSVRFLNGASRVIYRNRASADPAFANKAAIQVLSGPGIEWKYFNTQKDHDLLWTLIRKNTQEMPQTFKTSIKKKTGKSVYLENNEISTAAEALGENKNSNILSSISELS